MKENKYRACISPKTVIPFTLEDLVNPEPLFSIRDLVIPWLRAGNKPDDFTGLKDKNGVEIYEWDIVKANGMFPSVIIFEDGGFNLEGGDSGLNLLYQLEEYGDYVIIDNIHENPELLDARCTE